MVMASDRNEENLPDFLGLGVQRAGTTWLYKMIDQHPDICTASGRKEVHFFDRYFERGIEWYRKLFQDCSSDTVKGEITPAYFFHEGSPRRISQIMPNCKFIVILREPVDRAYSHFKFHIRETGYSGTFEEFIEDNSDSKFRGLYSKQFQRYFEYFSPDQFCVFIFEEMFDNKEQLFERLFDFLGIDTAFDVAEQENKVNYSAKPKFHGLYVTGKKLTRKLHDWGFSRIVQAMRNFGLKEFFLSPNRANNEFPPLKEDTRIKLINYYRKDVERLSQILDKNMVKIWDYD